MVTGLGFFIMNVALVNTMGQKAAALWAVADAIGAAVIGAAVASAATG